MNVPNWIASVIRQALPDQPVKSVVEWCRKNVRLIGSARSEAFDPDITPWSREPLECARVPRMRMTYVKPVQSGGSAVGEMALCYWISTENGGDIFYYWQNDEKAADRWDKRVERIFTACAPVVARITDRGPAGLAELRRIGRWTKGSVNFPHCNFTMLGVNSNRNVASESIRFEVNEEIHDAESGWAPGKLEQCYGRTTAFWNSVIFNISNAATHGSQLHTAFEAGTQRHWEVRCPGCGLYHVMQTRWQDDRPDLGGLRYDSDSCRLEDGEVNYSKLLPTIRYQMPCGYIVHDDNSERRALSLSGRYGAARNPGAQDTEQSFTLEAVAVDYIPWVQLIKQKRLALKALRQGDPKPWFDYLRERECKFVREEDRPMLNRILLSSSKKDREGLPHRIVRFGALDRQKGSFARGELPHWWGLIQDVALEKVQATEEMSKVMAVSPGQEVEIIHVLTVFEGKLHTPTDAAEVMKRHDVKPACVVVDSGWDTVNVYQFCLEHGFSCIKDESELSFSHGKGVRRIYSPEVFLHEMLNQPPSRQNPADEPMFWHVSKIGIFDRLHWLRTSPMVHYEVPGDVSKDFIEHMDAWAFERLPTKRQTKETVYGWVQHKTRDDLMKCAAYIGMLMDMAGIIGDTKPEQRKDQEK